MCITISNFSLSPVLCFGAWLQWFMVDDWGLGFGAWEYGFRLELRV